MASRSYAITTTMQHHPLHHCSPNFHIAAASIFGVFSLSMSPFHVPPRVREISRGTLLHCFCLKRLLPIAMYRTSTAPQFAFCHHRLSPLQELSATPADRLPPLVKSCFKDFLFPSTCNPSPRGSKPKSSGPQLGVPASRFQQVPTASHSCSG